MKLAMLITLCFTATLAPDLSSPVAAVRSLQEAVERHDIDSLRQVFFAGSDGQRKLVDAYATLLVAGKRLADAAQERFGDTADAIAQGAMPALGVDQLESAVVNQKGDTATLKSPNMLRPIQLRRTGAGWQIVLDNLAASPDRIEAQVALTGQIAEALGELAGETSAGRYATVADAETAIQQRINEVMTDHLRVNPPSTGPSTRQR